MTDYLENTPIGIKPKVSTYRKPRDMTTTTTFKMPTGRPVDRPKSLKGAMTSSERQKRYQERKKVLLATTK